MKNKSLLSVSGRIGSGKDTVASMIKFITHSKTIPRIKGLSLFDEWKTSDELSNWEVKKFAGKLKTIASILTGFPVEKFEDRDFKDSYFGYEWSFWSQDGVTALNKRTENLSYEWERMTARKFLQKLGTEGLRNGLHENVWVNALFADYTPSISPLKARRGGSFSLVRYMDSYPKWIITDMRFENELEAVRDRDGICIRLTRNSSYEASHSSETALDHITDWDYVIDNKDQSLEETFGEVEGFVNEFGLV